MLTSRVAAKPEEALDWRKWTKGGRGFSGFRSSDRAFMGQPAAGQLELGSGSPPAGLARQPVARAPSLRRDYLELELAVKSLSPSLRLSLSNSLVVPAAAGGAGHTGIPASPLIELSW